MIAHGNEYPRHQIRGPVGAISRATESCDSRYMYFCNSSKSDTGGKQL